MSVPSTRESQTESYLKKALAKRWVGVNVFPAVGVEIAMVLDESHAFDEILLDPNIARNQIRQKGVGKRMVGVERPGHFVPFNDLQSRGGNCGGGPDTNILTPKALLTKKIAWPQNGDNGLLASIGGHGEFHAACSNVHERLRDIALRENSSSCCKTFTKCDHSGQIE